MGMARAIAAGSLLLIILALGFVQFLVHSLPSPWPYVCVNGNGPARCLVESAGNREDLDFVPREDMPLHLRQAFVAAEDERFYRHPGIDPVSMARALWHNLQAGRIVQGGSSITQQLAKNLYLTPERTLDRKAREFLLALKLERDFSKDDILTAYLNLIYFGHGHYGIADAAEHYYQKEPRDLSLAESAQLAGLTRGPALYCPFNRPEASRRRQLWVLEQMERAGYISPEEALRARKEELTRALTPAGLATVTS